MFAAKPSNGPSGRSKYSGKERRSGDRHKIGVILPKPCLYDRIELDPLSDSTMSGIWISRYSSSRFFDTVEGTEIGTEVFFR
jgi:hypothetical protein